MRSQAIIVAALLSVAHRAAAQFIGGHVMDSHSDRSVAGIRVVATQNKNDMSAANTDSSGNFYIGPLRPGVYRLRVADGTLAPFMSDTLRVTADAFVQRRFSYDSTARRVYYPHEVHKEAAGVVGSRAPRYPDDLRKRGITGEVIARFVVDTAGRMIEGTFVAMPNSDPRFVPAVLEALRRYGFHSAELPNGRRVQQYVFMPFQFDIR
jgi:TonB family protein